MVAFRVLLADFGVLRPVGISYCLGDRSRDRPCRDPLKRDSGRYAITLITLLEVRTSPKIVVYRKASHC